MGGAAGHIKQLWENTYLTFKDIKDIVNLSFKGKLKEPSEKLDGQNILFTSINGKAHCARETSNLKNFGENAMDLEATKLYFNKRNNPPSVEVMFTQALNSFQEFLDKNHHVNEILQNGRYWVNTEIICFENVNVIPYFEDQLFFHHLIEIDENGKRVSLVNITFGCEGRYGKFTIHKTKNMKMVSIHDKYRLLCLDELKEIQGSFSDEQTIGDYLLNSFAVFINFNVNESHEFVSKLARRWALGDKSTTITKLLKECSEETAGWVKTNDEYIKGFYDYYLEPFVTFFSKLGISILRHQTDIATLDGERAITSIRNRIGMVPLKVSYDNPSIKKFYDWFNRVGGINSVVPLEGIVFKYKDDLYKITGSFTPILRLLGAYRFGV